MAETTDLLDWFDDADTQAQQAPEAAHERTNGHQHRYVAEVRAILDDVLEHGKEDLPGGAAHILRMEIVNLRFQADVNLAYQLQEIFDKTIESMMSRVEDGTLSAETEEELTKKINRLELLIRKREVERLLTQANSIGDGRDYREAQQQSAGVVGRLRTRLQRLQAAEDAYQQVLDSYGNDAVKRALADKELAVVEPLECEADIIAHAVPQEHRNAALQALDAAMRADEDIVEAFQALEGVRNAGLKPRRAVSAARKIDVVKRAYKHFPRRAFYGNYLEDIKELYEVLSLRAAVSEARAALHAELEDINQLEDNERFERSYPNASSDKQAMRAALEAVYRLLHENNDYRTLQEECGFSDQFNDLLKSAAFHARADEEVYDFDPQLGVLDQALRHLEHSQPQEELMDAAQEARDAFVAVHQEVIGSTPADQQRMRTLILDRMVDNQRSAVVEAGKTCLEIIPRLSALEQLVRERNEYKAVARMTRRIRQAAKANPQLRQLPELGEMMPDILGSNGTVDQRALEALQSRLRTSHREINRRQRARKSRPNERAAMIRVATAPIDKTARVELERQHDEITTLSAEYAAQVDVAMGALEGSVMSELRNTYGHADRIAEVYIQQVEQVQAERAKLELLHDELDAAREEYVEREKRLPHTRLKGLLFEAEEGLYGDTEEGEEGEPEGSEFRDETGEDFARRNDNVEQRDEAANQAQFGALYGPNDEVRVLTDDEVQSLLDRGRVEVELPGNGANVTLNWDNLDEYVNPGVALFNRQVQEGVVRNPRIATAEADIVKQESMIADAERVREVYKHQLLLMVAFIQRQVAALRVIQNMNSSISDRLESLRHADEQTHPGQTLVSLESLAETAEQLQQRLVDMKEQAAADIQPITDLDDAVVYLHSRRGIPQQERINPLGSDDEQLELDRSGIVGGDAHAESQESSTEQDEEPDSSEILNNLGRAVEKATRTKEEIEEYLAIVQQSLLDLPTMSDENQKEQAINRSISLLTGAQDGVMKKYASLVGIQGEQTQIQNGLVGYPNIQATMTRRGIHQLDQYMRELGDIQGKVDNLVEQLESQRPQKS